MTDTDRSRVLRLEQEVPGTPEQVWEAIATGPGITAWFVPTTVEGRDGGEMTQEFGPGMSVTGRVHAWDPPHRFGYSEHASADAEGMAFEFLVEAKDSGTCIVRLVNSGFGHGEDWDDQYDGMEQGWRIFLHVLRLHLEGFAGQPAARVQAMAMIEAPDGTAAVMQRAMAPFAFDQDRLEAIENTPAPLAGTVTLRQDYVTAFTVDTPAPGTGFIAVEGRGPVLAVSLWLAFYGPDAKALAERDGPRWQAWVDGLTG